MDMSSLQAKPKPNLSGAKEKAVKPSAASSSEPPTIGLKKRPKEEWSCALCQVSTANEKVLSEHLRGKKHKAKETGLISPRELAKLPAQHHCQRNVLNLLSLQR